MSTIYTPSSIPLRIPFAPNRRFNFTKPIRVTNLTTKLTDYQIAVNLNTSNFAFEKARPNGEDIRFQDANGKALNYWIESWTATTAKIWMKLDELESYEDRIIWLIYGNCNAKGESNGNNTFERFDNFEDSWPGNWTGETGSYVKSTDRSFDGSNSLKKTAAAAHANSELYLSESTQNIEVWVRLWNSDTLNKRGGPAIGILSGNCLVCYIDPGTHINIMEFTSTGTYVAKQAEAAISAVSSDQWCKLALRRLGNTYTAFAYNAAGTQVGTCSYNKSATTGNVGLHMYDTAAYFDQFLVRKYVLSKPLVEVL